MPTLHWSSKSKSIPEEGGLITEAVFFPAGKGISDAVPINRLILGDNLRVMNALMDEYEEKIDLIYADPPFFTNKGYSARIGRGEDSRKPEEWQLAEGYPDQWDDLDSYLDMLYPRLALMHRLLSPTGSLFLHLDWHANSYARILLDEIFGYQNYRNEIIWTYHGPSPIRRAFNRKHDMILFYSKTDQYTFNVDDVRIPYSENTVETFKSSKKAGFGKVPDLKRGKVPEDWWYFPVVARLHNERTGYPTQKPESIMDRIIQAGSNPGDLVADFFSGAGTTAVVASRNNRYFINSDTQSRALHTTRSRLVLGQDKKTSEGGQESLRSTPVLIQREERIKGVNYHTLEDFGVGEVSLQGGRVSLPKDLISQVDYWEIDPDWNGKLFHSCFQAARPWRKGEVDRTIQLPSDHKKICLRIVLITGEQIQQVI
jgi:DNA modification methylase